MKGILGIILIILIFSCNSKNNEKTVYKGAEKELVNYRNLLIKNADAKNVFVQGLKNVEKGQYENAYSNFIKADKIEPNNVIILNALANIENINGKKIEAERKYKRALKIDSSYIYSYVNYGKFLHQKRQYQDADKILKMGFKHNPTNLEKVGLFYNLTFTNVMLGKCNKAKEFAILAKDNSETENQKMEMQFLIEDVEKQCVNK